MHLTDTHAHLYFHAYEEDRPAVLARAWSAGVEQILVPGIDLPSSQAALELAESDPRIFAAVGVHPNDATTWDDRSLDFLEAMAAHPKVVAIGEIGLDYYREHAPHDLQRRIFREQVELAGRLNLPVVVHTRNAGSAERSCMADTLQILAESGGRGVLHSFSGNPAEAEQVLALGFYLGITGPVTFKKADELRQVVAAVPLGRLLTETDSPFLTPQPHRGRRNEPAHVRFVAETIAEIHHQPLAVVAQATTENARRLFQWSD